MKKLAFIFVISLLIGCKKDNDITPKEYVEKRKLDDFIQKLVDKYPNYEKNEMVRDKMTKELDSKVDSIFNNKVFDDIPLSVFKITKNPHGKGALVHLYSNNEYSDELHISNSVTFDVICFLSEDQASKISDNSKYYVVGKNVNRISSIQASILVPMQYYSAETEIKQDIYGGKVSFNIGNAAMEVDSLILQKE